MSLNKITMMAFAAGLVLPLTATAAGDPALGKQQAETCLGCHGIEYYTNVYPTYSVPKLGGQNGQYIIDALKGYASGDRGHATMHAQASSLSDQDIRDIAAFFESLGGQSQ